MLQKKLWKFWDFNLFYQKQIDFLKKTANLKLVNYCPHSLMDRMRACGVCDVGSIPTEGTIDFWT